MSHESRLFLFLLGAAACGDATPTAPREGPTEPGAIRVEIVTLGSALDPDGYTVVLDSSGPRSLGIHDSLTLNDLSEGPHSVRLGDLASTCEINGSNPYRVTVDAGQLTLVPFQVICQPPGELVVTISTSGTSADSDGYRLTLSRTQDVVVELPSNGSVAVPDLAPGLWAVEVTEVASQCLLIGPSQVRVDSAASSALRIDVHCTTPSTLGRIRVTVSTTAILATLPSSYRLLLDGNPVDTIPSNGAVTLTDVPAGSHRVHLDVLPGYCGAWFFSPPLSQDVVVTAGSSVAVRFSVLCLG
jgi:hypothetical protein